MAELHLPCFQAHASSSQGYALASVQPAGKLQRAMKIVP